MDEHRGFVLLRERGDILHALKTGGVLGVETQHIRHKLVRIIKAQVLALDLGRVFVKIVQRTANDRAEARIYIRPDIGIVVEIHIKAGCYAAREVLHYGELGHDIQHIRRKLCLSWEHLFIQPAVQRHIVRHGAQEGHRRVRMCVFKTRYKQITLEVYLPVKLRHFRLFGAYIANAAAVYPHFVVRYLGAAHKAKPPAVIKSYHLYHPISLFPEVFSAEFAHKLLSELEHGGVGREYIDKRILFSEAFYQLVVA